MKTPKDKVDIKIFLIQMELKKDKPNLYKIDKLCFQMNNLFEQLYSRTEVINLLNGIMMHYCVHRQKSEKDFSVEQFIKEKL